MKVVKKPFLASIKGIDWEFHAQKHASYVRKHGSDSGAITYPDDREVHFNLSQISPYFVRHELFHAFVASSSSKAASLSKDQMEELGAEIYGEHGPEIDCLADKILSYFLR